MHYDGSVALVTGGSSGIGLGLARALVERDARVALIGTNEEKLDAAVKSFASGRAIGVRLDVRDAGEWPHAVARVEAELGPIDFLALNAGAQCGRASIEDIAPDDWRWVWDVNVGGVYNGLRACLPAMKRRGTPAHVMTTASIASFFPRPSAAAYGASKAAALAIMEALRLELEGSPVSASVFCPAMVRTDFASTNERHSPGADAETFAFMRAVIDQGLDPLDVGRYVLDAIDAGRFYLLSHPDFLARVQPRLDEIRAAFEEQQPIAQRHFSQTKARSG